MEFKSWLAHLRACPHCHSWLGKTDLFCASCWEFVLANRLWKKIDEYRLDITSLFCWREGDEIISELIYSLKGGGLKEANERLARWILASVEPKDLVGVTFVPAPARELGQRDHASMLAKSLSDLSCRPLVGALQRIDIDTQKHLSRSDRLMSKLDLSGAMSVEEANKQSIIFIDDVVTTGATAQAAYLAMGRPKNFKVWALAYRPRLAWAAPL